MACVFGLNLITEIIKSTAQQKAKLSKCIIRQTGNSQTFLFMSAMPNYQFYRGTIPRAPSEERSMLCCYRGVYRHHEPQESHSVLVSLGLGMINEGDKRQSVLDFGEQTDFLQGH